LSEKVILMKANLRPNEVLTTGQLAKAAVKQQQDLPLGEIAAERAKRREAVTSDRNAVVAKWLDDALDKHPKAASVAADCGISEAYLSQMRKGERTIPAHMFLSILEWSPSAESLLRSLAERSGRFAVHPIIEELTPLQKRIATKKYMHRIRAVGLVHSAARREVAEEMGVAEERIEELFDEPTGAHHFGGTH
jgi:hypothetical protein